MLVKRRTSEPLFQRTWVPPALAVAAVVVFGAETYIRNGDYESPLTIWQDTVHKVPLNARAHYSVGRELHTKADGNELQEQEALKSAETALEHTPNYIDARTLRATILERLASNADMAARAMATEAAFATADGHWDAADELGQEADRQEALAAKHFATAEKDLNWVLEHHGDKCETWTNLGNLYARQRQTERAIGFYDLAIAKNDKSALAFKNRGSAYMILDKRVEAERDLRQAIELEKLHPNWYFMLALDLVAQNKVDEAVDVLQQAIQRGAVSSEVYGSLGALLLKRHWTRKPIRRSAVHWR